MTGLTHWNYRPCRASSMKARHGRPSRQHRNFSDQIRSVLTTAGQNLPLIKFTLKWKWIAKDDDDKRKEILKKKLTRLELDSLKIDVEIPRTCVEFGWSCISLPFKWVLGIMRGIMTPMTATMKEEDEWWISVWCHGCCGCSGWFSLTFSFFPSSFLWTNHPFFFSLFFKKEIG